MEDNSKAPSKEEVIKFLNEQIEVKTVQANLQELNTKLAVLRMEEIKALGTIAQMTNPQRQSTDVPDGLIPHVVTEDDIKNNPELSEEGVKVGDEILIPGPTTAPEDRNTVVAKPKALKKDK